MSARPSGIGSLARYENFEQVGEGTYGYVYRARDRRSGDSVALKRLIFHKEGAGFPLSAVREIKFLKSLQHRNIVILKDIVSSKGCEHIELPVNSDTPRAVGGNTKKNPDIESMELQRCGNLYLVFEYVQHDLGGLIDAKYPFSLSQMKFVMRQLFEVLDYLHGMNVYHRDIKSSNILISSGLQVKLADFGLARSVAPADIRYMPANKPDLTINVITLWYRPPELLLGQLRYNGVIDVWSAGCVLAEMCLHRPLFPGKTEAEQMDLIMKVVGTPTEDNWPGVSLLPNYASLVASQPLYTTSFSDTYSAKIAEPVVSLLSRLLVMDPAKRVSAKAAQLTSFFLPSPADNERLDIAINESLHEYQTKKKRRDNEKLKLAASKRKHRPAEASVEEIPASSSSTYNDVRSSSGGVITETAPIVPTSLQSYGYCENNWYTAAMHQQQQQQHQYYYMTEAAQAATLQEEASEALPECDDFSSFTTVQNRNDSNYYSNNK